MAELTWSKSPLPGDILKIWPKDEKGEPVKPACLTHCVSNDFQDVMLVNMLMSYEIPAFTSAGSILPPLPKLNGRSSTLFVRTKKKSRSVFSHPLNSVPQVFAAL